MFPRFSEENFAGNLRLVEELTTVAEEKGVKVGQLVLAWIWLRVRVSVHFARGFWC
jgi:aryl-alcohol dehydrogenase-like predicted oxidoreductase